MNENEKGNVGSGVSNFSANKRSQVRGGDGRSKASLLWLFFLVMVVLIIGSAAAGFFLDQQSGLNINLSYVSLALIGVLFHLANQYRLRRDEEGFDWNEYQFDYYFRALQACIYVIVIDFIVSKDQTGLSGEMTVIALFVGMYIRRVEEAFETLGDRFGDMIKGILGSTAQRLTPAERRQKLAELEEQWTTLNQGYLDLKPNLGEEERKKVEDLISKAKDLILKGKAEAAEIKLLHLDFKVKDLQASGS
jgi:hypothetical protein